MEGRNAGFHVHVAEGPADEKDSLAKYSKRIVERFRDHGITGANSIFVHCIHTDETEREIIRETNTAVVHNPESNMGNAVGSANIRAMIEEGILVGLGTDGYICDMIQSYRLGNALCKHSSGDPGAGWGELPQMLFINNARIAERCFPVKLGMIKEGYAADIIVMDYMPPTEISEKNINGHLLFGSSGRNVVTTIANGKVLMKDRKLTELDRERIFAKARECSKEVWKRL
jgi:cytosine/adenosine deaminase-related metal-dependent hydrolase